jgi:hypothetical protein
MPSSTAALVAWMASSARAFFLLRLLPLYKSFQQKPLFIMPLD